MPIEVLTTSHEQAAAGVAELWLDGELLGSTYMSDDRRLILEIRAGPWRVEMEDLHKALEKMEELLGWERPGRWRADQDAAPAT
jgi:hypothetical protein